MIHSYSPAVDNSTAPTPIKILSARLYSLLFQLMSQVSTELAILYIAHIILSLFLILRMNVILKTQSQGKMSRAESVL